MFGNKGWRGQSFAPDGKTYEQDAFTCIHCQKITPVKPYVFGRNDGPGWCTSCNAAICDACCGKGCDHFERKLARAEARDRLFQCMRCE
jgi:hypothetical protein